jgi:integrase/recombinase XerC
VNAPVPKAALTVSRPGPGGLSSAPGLDADGYRRLRDAFLAGRNENTQRAYRQAVIDFGGFLSRRAGRPVGEQEALRELLEHGPGAANLLGLDYRGDLAERKLSSGTIAARLSCLRALVRMARLTGMVSWTLEVQGPKVRRYRDTAGPPVEVVRAMAAHVRTAASPARAARDRALLALLYGAAFRRAEVLGLDMEHLDLAGARVNVLAKGQRERSWVPIRPEVVATLKGWLELRPGPLIGPVFVSWSATAEGPQGRLTGGGLAVLVARWGLKAAGVRVRPHGLRHAAATHALDAGETWSEVAGMTRHQDPSVLAHYDDNRLRRGGRAAARLAELVAL